MTRNELTQIEGTFEYAGSEKSWDVGASRWTKGDNDRLYFNDAEYVDYVDLQSLIVRTSGSRVQASAEIEGDTLTVEATLDALSGEKKWTAVFELPEDLAEETDDDEDEEREETDGADEELVADGGEPTVDEEFDDEEIEGAIDSQGSTATVGEVRDVIQTVQEGFEILWSEHMDSVEDNAMELVAIDGDVLVFADHTNQFWNAEFDNGPLAERDLPERMQSVVTHLQHNWARRHSDYDWGVDDPVVVRKPDNFDAGQRLVEAVMLNLTNRGLSPRQAWSVWGVLAGNSRNNWATRMGYDSHSGVSNAVREAKENTPLPYL